MTSEPDWSQFPAGGRRETLLKALQRLWELCPGPVTIVETGTTRDASEEGRKGDGWSTLAFAWYAYETKGEVWTVDVSRESLNACRRVTQEYMWRVEYVESDSIPFLRGWRHGLINLLYLDSLDYAPTQEEASARHHLAEAQAALPALADRCLILFDDTGVEIDGYFGKGALAIPWLIQQGFKPEWSEGGQVLLSRG